MLFILLHRYHAWFYYLETRSVFPIFHAPYFLFYTLRIFRENYLLGFKNISVFLICKVLNYVLCQQCNCSFNFGMENSTITITEKKIQIFVILIIYHNSPSLTWLKTLTQLETREPGNAKTWQYGFQPSNLGLSASVGWLKTILSSFSKAWLTLFSLACEFSIT